MNVPALKAHIQTRLDAGDTDAEVLTWLKADVTVLGTISTKRMLGWTVSDDVLRGLDAIAADVAAADAKRGLARGTAQLIRSQTDLDVGDAETQTLLASAVSLGVITQGQRDALEARAATTMPRCQSLGYRAIDDNSWLTWIAAARAA